MKRLRVTCSLITLATAATSTSAIAQGVGAPSVSVAAPSSSSVAAPAVPPAEAQLGQTGASPAAIGSHVEDIVVTAQRRSEQLQRVPISITAITSAGLARSAITDTQSLTAVTPGLQLNSVRAAVTPFLRGVGTLNITAGDEGATAIYVDGILNPVAAANVFALNNVERVEVLRGPQGTLFGRNAVGGLINVITKDPTYKFGGNAEIGYGNYNTLFGSGYITGGLTDNVAADLAVYGTRQGDGWGRDFFLNRDANRDREYALRSKILWQPGDNTRVTFSGDYSHADNDQGSSRQVLPGSRVIGGATAIGTIYDTNGEVIPLGRKTQYGGSIKIEQTLGDFKLQSTSAYRHYHVNSNLDSDGTPVEITAINTNEFEKTFQQEFLLTGSVGRLDLTAGLFYFYSDATYSPFFTGSSLIKPNNVVINSKLVTNSYAAFSQGTYHVTDSTRVTLGLRYTIDTREIDAIETAGPGNPRPPGTVLLTTASEGKDVTDRTFRKLTFHAVIDQQLAQNVMLFGSVSRGFKSGVFSTAAPFAPAVSPETLTAYEAGIKADFFDHRARVNISGFHYDYDNIQLSAINALGAPQLLNAAKGRINGMDGELTYVAPVAVGHLQLRTSISVLDAKYASFPRAQYYNPLPTGGNASVLGDATDNRMLEAPKFTSSAGLDYDYPVDHLGTVGFSITWAHNSGFFWDPQNRLKQPAYDTVNGQLSLALDDSKTKLRVFVRNMLDKKYFIYVTPTPVEDGAAAAPPRTFGIALSRSF